MDLQLAFANWQPQDPAYDQRLQAATRQRTNSRHPLERLRRAIRVNLTFAAVITVGYLALFPFMPHPLVMVFLGVMLLYNVWAMVNTWQHYARIPASVSAMNDVLAEMKTQVTATTVWMKLHVRTGLLIYPLAITGGFLLGALLGTGATPAELMSKPPLWWILGAALLVLVPLCHYTVKWMTHLAFGVHVEALRRSIAELEA
ncbi:MAG: hypothetical protein JNM31_08265 [Flavobacteriales bacterium]|nr:hypothetical protein [Flavobacteriales bacterium]